MVVIRSVLAAAVCAFAVTLGRSLTIVDDEVPRGVVVGDVSKLSLEAEHLFVSLEEPEKKKKKKRKKTKLCSKSCARGPTRLLID